MAAEALRLTSIETAHSEGIEDVELVAFNGPLSPSIHLLIGYGFELNLKAIYLLLGGEAAKLSKPTFGHDLIAALNAAEALGFVTTVQDLRWTLENLRVSHLSHHWRYGGKLSITIPSLEMSIPRLQQLTREVMSLGLRLGVTEPFTKTLS